MPRSIQIHSVSVDKGPPYSEEVFLYSSREVAIQNACARAIELLRKLPKSMVQRPDVQDFLLLCVRSNWEEALKYLGKFSKKLRGLYMFPKISVQPLAVDGEDLSGTILNDAVLLLGDSVTVTEDEHAEEVATMQSWDPED